MLAEQAWQKMFEMPQIAIIVGCIFGCLIPIAGIIASFWYKSQKAQFENELKRKMVDRGMSADEIERILAAEGSEPRDARL